LSVNFNPALLERRTPSQAYLIRRHDKMLSRYLFLRENRCDGLVKSQISTVPNQLPRRKRTGIKNPIQYQWVAGERRGIPDR
jgi:hypothetical protein